MPPPPSDLAHSALEAAPDAMVVISGAGIIRYANRQVSTLFGYAHDEVIGQPIDQLLPPRFRLQHVQHRAGYVRAVRQRPMGVGLALFGQRKDGTELPVEISLRPIEGADEVLIVATIREVTDHRRTEADRIVARDTADRARQATEAPRSAADEARASRRADQNKSRFLAAASHDLRQPLQTLALLNGSLRRMARDPDIAAALAQQEQAIAAMSRLLNALLDISKLESGAVKPVPTDFTVASLFDELRRDFTDLADAKGLQLVIEPSTDSVHSDPSLVEQILRNLLSNAIKYTSEGWVRLRCLRQSTLVRIEVLDTGAGIAADQLPLIYEEFYQVAPDSSREGYGLGLSIVQRLVKLLQLKLDVTSQVGKGSTFALLLPGSTARLAGMPAGSKQAPQQHCARPRVFCVLLVEDEPDVRDAMRLLLKVEGYRVVTAAGLEEALGQLELHGSFDLIITDYHLSGGETGIQVISALRERAGRRLKAVLITGDTSSAVKELAADPDLRVTSKPVNAEDLLALLHTVLAGA